MITVSPDHSSRAHHPLGPSTLNYVDPQMGGCLGFHNREGDNEAAAEGTTNHEIVDAAITAWKASDRSKPLLDFFPEADEDTRRWHEFVAASIQPYLDKATAIYNEVRIQITTEDGKPVTFGTTDLGLLIPDDEFEERVTLVVLDFKFGYLDVPEPEHNRQGWAYACGLLEMLGAEGIVPDYVETGFVQPKRESFRTHKWRVEQFWGEKDAAIRNLIQAATFTRANMADTLLNPGAACDYCELVGKCPAHARIHAMAARKSMQLPEALALNVDAIDTPEKAAAAMAWLGFVDSCADKIKAKCRDVAEEWGGSVQVSAPDGTEYVYELKRRQPSRVATDVEGIKVALGDMGVPPETVDGVLKVSIPLAKLENEAAGIFAENAEEKMTKKAAKEKISSTLEALGLVERQGDVTPYLKRKQIKKQIKEEN